MAIPEKIYETNGAEETFEVGMRLAKEAKAGDIYCLDGAAGRADFTSSPATTRSALPARSSMKDCPPPAQRRTA